MSDATQRARVGVQMVDLATDDPIIAPIFASLSLTGGPLNIHRILANAPEFYAGFSDFASVLRGPGETSRADRELVILRTVHVHGADYELIQHRRIGLAVGLTDAQVDGIASWRNQDCYSDRQVAMLDYTDRILQKNKMDAAFWTELRHHLSDREIVELTFESAFYTAVSQITYALPVPQENRVTRYGE